MKKGEYITHIDGRIGSWTDELKIYTSRGKVLKGGDDGGGDYDPQYEGKSCIVGFDFHWHHHLVRTDVYYLDLDQTYPYQVKLMPECTGSDSEHSEKSHKSNKSHKSDKSDKSKKSSKSSKSSKSNKSD